MTIEGGTAIVLTYVFVSMGVIIAFLLAAFVIGWFIGRLRQRRRTARRRVTYPGSRDALASGAHHPATGRLDDPLLGRLTLQLTKDQYPVLLE